MADVHKEKKVLTKYLRDGRAPIPEKESTSKVMSANRAKNTKPELLLRRALRASGINGYRLNWKKAPGSPDIAFPGKKIAIFVNGCFWHRCQSCNYTLPKSNTAFWENKFSKNVSRDNQKIEALKFLGWHVFVVWECEIKKDLRSVVEKLKNNL